MSSAVVRTFELNQLFRDISDKFSPRESAEVVKSLKRIYGEHFHSLQNEDLLSCLGLLQDLGYVSNSKLTLIKDFVAAKSSSRKEINEIIDDYIDSHPPLYDPEKQLQGRDDDFKRITATLETGQPSVVNLHGPGGVGKTTLAQEICSKWRGGKSYIFDLREAKDLRAMCFNIMNKLGLPVRLGSKDMSFVVEKIFERAFEESEGLPLLFLLDNVEQFTLGQGKEGSNLKTSFMLFLGKLLGYDKDRKTIPLRILLTSRTPLNEANKVEDYELQPLRCTFSEELLLSDKTIDINIVQKQKLLNACNGKPLLVKGLAAILKQERKLPRDLIDEIEKFIQDSEEKGDMPKSKHDKDVKEKAYCYEEAVGHGEKSVIHEMFNTLPSDCLKVSAVSLSLFCGPFSALTAAQVLGISLPEAVAQLEGLETSAIIFVVNREQKELMYDIHPLLKNYADSIKDDERFIESYMNARRQFYEHFMSKVKTIAGFVEADHVQAFKMFTSDSANYKFAIDISLESKFFSIPGEFHDIALIVSLVNALLSNEKRLELFKSWAENCSDDGKSGSLFHAHLKCWESLYVLQQDGPYEAFKVLEQAAYSLKKVQDQTAENFTLTQGLYLYFKGEIYYKKANFKKALECFQSSLDYTEKLLQVNDILPRCYNAMGNCYNGLKDFTKALAFYTKALEMDGAEYHNLPVYKNQIGTIYEGLGNYEMAAECYKEAIRLLEVLEISDYEEEANFCRNLANAYLFQGKFEEAMKPADKALEIRRKCLGDHPDTVQSIFQQGIIQANLQETEQALNLFRNAWEMEKSLKPGNHSKVWKMLIDAIIDLIGDDSQKTEFKKEALAFCQHLWKEERESSWLGFTEHKRVIIDTVAEFLRDIEGEEDVKHNCEKEELWFYDGFQGETEKDFYTRFDAAMDNQELNKMLKNRVELLDKILELCNRLDMHADRLKHTRSKLNLYSKVLFKANFVGDKGYEKETLRSKVEQLYEDLDERESITKFRKDLLSSWRLKWEQREGIEETTEMMSSLARQRLIRSILQLCLDLKEKKLHRRYGEEALLFYEELWTIKFEEMDKRKIKKFLRDIKALASSVGDNERKDLYQDILQKFINTGIKPAALGPKVPLLKETTVTQWSVSGEEEKEESKTVLVEEDEEVEVTSEDSEDDQEVNLTSEEEIDISSEDENEYPSSFCDTNEGSTVLCREKVVKGGARWDLKQVAVHVIFPPGAVSEDRTLTLLRWNPGARSPPLHHHEAIVSDVIELSVVDSPGILHFNEAVTIVIPHRASSLKGYEVVIKTLINSETNDWDDIVETEDLRTSDDIKEDHEDPGDVPDFLFPVAVSKITQCSTFVVVCRLRLHQHTITSQESELVWPEFPLARISFPQNAIRQDESFEVVVELQEVSQKLLKQKQVLPGLILRLKRPRAVDFLKPVTIQLPLSLKERYKRRDIDMSVVRVRVLFKESSPEEQEWIEITDKLGTPPRYDGNIITFEVKHLSALKILVDCCQSKLALDGGSGAVIDQAVESAINKSDSEPKAASFLVFVPRDAAINQITELRLYCVPTCKKREVDGDVPKTNVKIGDGSSDKLMYCNDKAYMFLSGDVVTAVTPDRLHRFHLSFQDPFFQKSLLVRIERKGVLEASFHSSLEEDEDNMLCKLEMILPPKSDKTPVEFFGLPLRDTTFDDIPFDGQYGILTACKGVLQEIKREQFYDKHVELKAKMGLRAVKESFLAELSKLPQEHKERCFDKIVSALQEGGEDLKHIRDRLLEARAKINEPINYHRNICDVVADKIPGFAWKTLARDLKPQIPEYAIGEILEAEGQSPKECCRIVLRTWYQRFTSKATSQELMRCLTNMGFANLNWHIMKELGLVSFEDMPV
ncbi:uncharacterized protein [Montipora capricornis]|uniref:uncharacterized protein isoform X2 n=1 Tax=Montipora foliosa TaxID=591990 RepID=UPI0035F10F1B